LRALIASIRYNLGNLMRFSGRATLVQFWPYAIAVALLAFAVSGAVLVAAMARGFTEALRIAAARSHQPSTALDPAATDPMLEAFDLAPVLIATALTSLVAALLLAAAVARRLHDSDRHGAWGLLPVPFLIGSAALGPQMLETVRAAPVVGPPPGFFLLMLNNLLFYAALFWLIYLLVDRGTDRPNRFGPPPPPTL